MSLYRTIDVWERNDTRTVVRYRCFESLETGRYCVQSADFYDQGKATPSVEGQFIELLTEQDPVQRSGDHDTLADAIAAHKREFGEVGG